MESPWTRSFSFLMLNGYEIQIRYQDERSDGYLGNTIIGLWISVWSRLLCDHYIYFVIF